jgi:hypothetical protein
LFAGGKPPLGDLGRDPVMNNLPVFAAHGARPCDSFE